MTNLTLAQRIEGALQTATPEESLVALALEMKGQGTSQQEIYALFETQLLRCRDSNETFFDALANVMDRIVGWCRPEQRLFDTELRK